MESIKDFYDFVTDVWHFVKRTQAPQQHDQTTWDAINDRAIEICKEFNVKVADWMELLRRESIK